MYNETRILIGFIICYDILKVNAMYFKNSDQI
jgi:hypothetical protein